jgi:predicted GNAT superfamily acetyltransferase
MKIRPITALDYEHVLALNHESVHFLSPLDKNRLQELLHESVLHFVIEVEQSIVAFLIAFTKQARYDSINFRWFQERYANFIYIDRVVVSQTIQSKGMGNALYRAVLSYAKEQNLPLVCCEYDIDPPNPISEKFHIKLGFKEVGKQNIGNGKKWVSMQALEY